MPMLTQRHVKAAVALSAGLAMLAVMIVLAGPATLADAIQRASPTMLLLAGLAYALFFLVRGIRWRILLSCSGPQAVRVTSTTGITAVGWLANSILPFKAGDVLRAALLARRERVPGGASLATVALERVLDLLGLALVAAFGLALLPAVGGLPAWLDRALLLGSLVALTAVAALGLLVAFRERSMRLSVATVGRLGRPGAKVHTFLSTVIAGLDALARRPRLLLVLLPLTLVVSLLQAIIFTLLVVAFLPTTPLLLAFGGSALFLLSFVVSVTPGNVGTYEAAFAAVFAPLTSASWNEAVTAAVLTHVTTTLIVAILGGIGMFTLGLRPSAAALARAHVVGGGRA